MKILVFIGPSGSGKSTLLRELHRHGVIEAMPSWTTRPRRANEAGEGIDHHFVGDLEFAELQRAGRFLETVEVFGHRYGLPAIDPSRDGPIPAILVRAPLLDLVAKHFPDHVVYQIESDFEIARQRLGARNESPTETEVRLRDYEEELALGRKRCDRFFDTSSPLTEVVSAVERAIAEDFQPERSSR